MHSWHVITREHTTDTKQRLGMATNVIDVEGILFNKFAKSSEEPFQGQAPETSSWRHVLQLIRTSSVVAAEDSAVDMYRVDQLPSNYEGWLNTIGTLVQLDDLVPRGELVRIVVHVTKQFSGAQCAWTREFVRSTPTYRPPPKNSGFALVEYELNTPVADGSTRNLLKRQYLRPTDRHIWQLLCDHTRKGKGAPPLALLGSPGCGKSTMTQRLAYEMSSVHRWDVMYLQHIAGGQSKVHLFTPAGKCISGIIYNGATDRLIKLFSVIEGRELEPYVIADGFTDLKLSQLWNYNLAVTSGSSNESRMGSNLALLPSWGSMTS